MSDQPPAPKEDEAPLSKPEPASGEDEASAEGEQSAAKEDAPDEPADSKPASAKPATTKTAPAKTAQPALADRARALAMPAFQHVVALIASYLFAMSFGLNYGVSNQTSYLLMSKKVLDPALYKNDWLATQTTHYHLSFRYVGALLIALDRRGWAVAYGQVIAIVVGMMFVHYLLRSLVKPPQALAAFLGVVGVAYVSRTSSVAVTYVFDEILQPSTLGSVGLLAAAAFLARGRWRAAGIAMALSGFFHANYLLLELGAFGLAHLMLGREKFWRRSLELFIPPTLVLLIFLPMLMASAGGGKEAEIAQNFYMRIRSPHHFNLKGSEQGFLASLSWIALGLGFGARVLAHRIEVRRLGALLAGLATIIGVGVMFSTLWPTRTFNMLFAWRLMPHLELLLSVLFMAGLAEGLSRPERVVRAGPTALGAAILGLAVLAMFGAYHQRAALPKTVLAIFVLALLGVGVVYALVTASRVVGARAHVLARRIAPWVFVAAASVLVISEASARNPEAKKKSSLYSGGDKSMRDLCGWVMKKTSKDAVFLTPPDIETFRFQCERGIVVDWKTPPIVPKDLLAWIGRLEDVTGRKRITSRRDLAGYSSLDDKRLDQLRSKYHVDYVVARTGRKLYGLNPVFSARGYSVYDVRNVAAPTAAEEPTEVPSLEDVAGPDDDALDGEIDQ
ncbi:MAG: DUF6798 domain-containing protein [Polyangiaceae bacterium]